MKKKDLRQEYVDYLVKEGFTVTVEVAQIKVDDVILWRNQPWEVFKVLDTTTLLLLPAEDVPDAFDKRTIAYCQPGQLIERYQMLK